MATTTTQRRKYLFPDRIAAETAWREADSREYRQLRLARALYSGTITWGDRRGSYRFGVFDANSASGPWIVQVFHPNTGQEPALTIHDPYGQELREMERIALEYPALDSDSADILNGIREARNYATMSSE